MFYGHIFTIVTVHSIKDCQLFRSIVTSFLPIIAGHAKLPFELGNESRVKLDCT